MLCSLGHVAKALAAAGSTASRHLAPAADPDQRPGRGALWVAVGQDGRSCNGLAGHRDFRLNEPKGLAGSAAGRMCLEPLSRLLALTDRGQSLLQSGGEVVPQHGMSKRGGLHCAVCKLRGCLLWVCLGAESP